MSRPGLYLDEDVQSDALIAALRSRGIDLVTTSEAGMTRRSDHDQLRFATASPTHSYDSMRQTDQP